MQVAVIGRGEGSFHQEKSKRRRIGMLITKKMLLALTLVAALVGGTIGALVTHSNVKADNDTATTTTTTPSTDATQAAYRNDNPNANQVDANAALFKTPEEQAAYRQGYNDCSQGVLNNRTNAYAPSRASYTTRSSSRRAYYDYSSTRHGRTFWQKHRDKLTMAIGTGGGALIGGLVGGGKGAGIGALAGLGGSALYTYKLRHRTRRY